MNMSPSPTRVGWIDGMKFFSILWIFCLHFFTRYNCVYFSRFCKWGGYFLYGVSGKLCVALFCVILGYFCAKSGRDERRSCADYIFRRYLYFALWIMIALCLTGIISYLDRNTSLTGYWYVPGEYAIGKIVSDSIGLRDDLCSTYWCVQPFMIASIAIVVMNKKKANLFVQVLVALALYCTGFVWVMNCVLGSILFILVRDSRVEKIASKWYVQLPLLLAAFFMIKRDESTLTYALDGIAMVFLIMATFYNRLLQHLFGFKPFAVLGRYSMGVYMLHVPVFTSLGFFLYMNRVKIAGQQLGTLVSAIVCFFVCFPLAWLIEKLIAWLIERLNVFCRSKHASEDDPLQLLET